MKHEKQLTALTAALLAFVTALGAGGCLLSAFDLPLAAPGRLVWVCALASGLGAVLLSLRYGAAALLCLLALVSGWLFHDGRAAAQLLQLVSRMCIIYDRAYGWGIPAFLPPAEDPGFADWPVGIFCVLTALAVCRSVCRQRSAWLPVLTALLPLSACIVVTDTVPGEIWLLLLMAGLVILILTGAVRRENAWQGLRLTAASVLPVTIALICLFLAVPQKNYVNQSEILRENIITAFRRIPQLMDSGMRQLTAGLQGEAGGQVDLSALGERIPFTYPVMEVTADRSGTVYLRGQDYDLYEGLHWTATRDRVETFSRADGPETTLSIKTRRQQPLRHLPYYPEGTITLAGGYAPNEDGIREDRVACRLLPEDWRKTAHLAQPSAEAPEVRYLALPDTTRAGARLMIKELLAGASSNTEKADLIAAFVTSSADYDLDPSKMPAGQPDFALWFLKEGEKGYCVHFATAATVLLRAADVPARYVTGYLVEARAGKTVTVTEESAHAWAEYYEPNLDAWIPLEATPPAALPPAALPEQTAPRPTEASAQAETRPVPAVTEPRAPAETGEAQTPAEPEPVPAEKPAVWLLIFAPLLLIPVQRVLRLKLRRRRQRTGESNRQALLRWQESVRLSRLLKETPTEELMHLAQKAKFSQYRMTDEELAQFDSFNRSCLRRLREKPWYRQLAYKYIYAAY